MTTTLPTTTIPTMATTAVMWCGGACIPGMAGVSDLSRCAADLAVFDGWNEMIWSGELKLRTEPAERFTRPWCILHRGRSLTPLAWIDSLPRYARNESDLLARNIAVLLSPRLIGGIPNEGFIAPHLNASRVLCSLTDCRVARRDMLICSSVTVEVKSSGTARHRAFPAQDFGRCRRSCFSLRNTLSHHQ